VFVRLLREPLLHFLLLGAGLFVAAGLMSKGDGAEPGRIVVTKGQIEHLAAGYERVHQRPPSADELDGLIRDWVREEAYCREALALGLDRDDPVIRQRLRQKMEFVSDDVAAAPEPTDADLQRYLDEHAEAFRLERRYTFSQVYLNPEHRRDALARDTTATLAELRKSGADADLAGLGDSFLLDHDFTGLPSSEVAKLFGEQFATALGALPNGEWQGPVESGYGVHLVLVRERTDGRVPALAEVRDAVRREWANVRRLEANEAFARQILERYVVTIERPNGAGPNVAMRGDAPR
jgi:PPIC-type PPIASE domain